jgi:deazaflavin-dependent oxidoreductase (nitroreductase family)
MRLRDRLARALVSAGLMDRSTALLETIGRRSGEPRVTPVTNGLDGDVFWIVTEHGRTANYVRNIEANPRVRVKAAGPERGTGGARGWRSARIGRTRGWRGGVALIAEEEDPLARLDRIVERNPRAKANAAIVRKDATELLVVRIDLDPA